jgi:hypothetical protein
MHARRSCFWSGVLHEISGVGDAYTEMQEDVDSFQATMLRMLCTINDISSHAAEGYR